MALPFEHELVIPSVLGSLCTRFEAPGDEYRSPRRAQPRRAEDLRTSRTQGVRLMRFNFANPTRMAMGRRRGTPMGANLEEASTSHGGPWRDKGGNPRSRRGPLSPV